MSEPTQATSSNTAPLNPSTATGSANMSTSAPTSDAPAGGEQSSSNNNRDYKSHRGFGSRGRGDRRGGRGDRRGGRGGGRGRGGRDGSRGRGGRGDSNSVRLGRDRKIGAGADDTPGEIKSSNMSIAFSAEEIAAEDRRPKKKVAVLIGYAGTGYKGMQINHTEKTIEGDLFAAFVAAGAIAKRNADDPKKSSFVRCARTDKGVHAAGNVISLKLTIEDADIVEKINSKLPEQIRVWSLQRTNNGFSCYQACDSRWYEYLLPSYTLLPPHPETYLGRKVIEAAKEKGVYESDLMKAWDDVKDFWEEVEKNDIKPILDRLDESAREEVLKLMHMSDHPDAKDEDDDETKPEKQSRKAKSAKRKAEANTGDDTDESATKKPKVEDAQNASEDNAMSGSKDEEQIPTVPDAESEETTAEETTAEETTAEETTAEDVANEEKEPTEAMDIDEKPTETTSAGDEPAEKGDAIVEEKPKYQPTPVELALKEIKTAYIAAKRRYRVTTLRVQQLQNSLEMYVGTRNFHNYTIQKSFKDPSAKRVIKSFVVNPAPIQIGDTEWLSLKVHGQSFMMHQIRKMVAMAVLSVRCAMPTTRIKETYGPTRISIPKAPGLGLLLERPVFESFSKKAVNDFGYEALNFDKHEKEINEFKHKQIYNRIFETEEREASFHTFLAQLDSFNTNYFLWLTAHGFGAAYEPKERYDPKAKRDAIPAAQADDFLDDDEDAEDGADGAGDEG